MNEPDGDARQAQHDDRTPRTGAGAADVTPSAGGDARFAETILHAAGESTPRPLPEAAPLGSRAFGDYVDLQEIGRGGMGVVYRALQPALGRAVAIKMIRSGMLAADQDVARFYAEAQAAAKLRHPNIVQVHHVGECDGQHYFAMEYIEGEDLARRIGREKFPPERTARLLKEVAEAIDHAHQRHIVHRDLKPANILIDRQDRPLVTDFGLAKDFTQETGLTASGSSLGTPSYMAPEQADGGMEDVGPAADVYALGAILYEMLTGRPPFRGPSMVDTLLDVVHKTPPHPSSVGVDVDPQLEAICLKCLQKDPRQRYPSAQALADDLGRFLDGSPVWAQPAHLLTRCWNWLRDVPLIGALAGRRVTHPSRAHRAFQWTLVAAAVVAAWQLMFGASELPYPRPVRIASGRAGGEYHALATAWANALQARTGRPTTVRETAGAVENRELLTSARVDVALVQAGAVAPFPDSLAVVTPLYEEFVLVVVPADSPVVRIEDLAGQQVLVGSRGSGMQQTARQALQRLGVTVDAAYEDFSQLAAGEAAATIVTSGTDNAILRELCQQHGCRIVPLTAEQVLELSALDVFKPRTLRAGALGPGTPPVDVRTVSTRSYLVAPKEASSRLVDDLLSTLPELEGNFRLEAPRNQLDWGPFPLHRAAERYFQESAQSLQDRD